MKNFKLYSQKSIAHLISVRPGEYKFGQKIQFVSSWKELKNSSAKYVLFGIPEDIGIRANFGKPGAASAWKSFLSSFLNIQENRFNIPEHCILLGEVDCEKWMKSASQISMEDANYHEKLGELVSELDEILCKIVSRIISEGKVPIIIGGGHNNAFGNIKGTSAALKKPINILNIDAHTDLRSTEFRHSGNGFSKAMEDGFMKKYAVFGLHENYTSEVILSKMDTSKQIKFQLYEDMVGFSPQEKWSELRKSADFLDKIFGLEIDCDSIANFSSSAMTPSGFSLDEIRGFIRVLNYFNPHYLHLCEASALNAPLVGKALSYLVSDFMKEKVIE